MNGQTNEAAMTAIQAQVIKKRIQKLKARRLALQRAMSQNVEVLEKIVAKNHAAKKKAQAKKPL